MEIVTKKEVEDAEIRDFLASDGRATLFQTLEFLQVLDRTKGYRGYWVGIRKSGDLVASAVFYDITDKTPVPGISVSRRIVMGGPLVKARDDMELIDRTVKIIESIRDCSKKPLFLEVRNLLDTSAQSKAYERCGFEFEGHLNFLIDLNKSEDGLLGSLDKKRRYGIRKCMKEKVTIVEVNDEKRLKDAYSLLRQTYDNARLPLADFSLFSSALNILGPKEMIKIFLAERNDVPVSTIILLLYRGTVYDWYAGASRDHLSLCPNDYITWHAIKYGKESGFSIFDFGGAGKPDEPYGVREFKKQFGGEMVNYGRYSLVMQPMLTSLGKKWISIKQKKR